MTLSNSFCRFLEAAQFFKQSDAADQKNVAYQASYDKELINIQDMFYEIVIEMLTKDMSSVVRRTLLTVCYLRDFLRAKNNTEFRT